MNLSLQQALKYGTKEDVVDSAVRGNPYPKTIPSDHLQIAADAFEDQGQEGHADLLREFSKGYRQQEPAHTALGESRPLRHPETEMAALNAHLHLIGPADYPNTRRFAGGQFGRTPMGTPTGLALVAHLNAKPSEGSYGPSHRLVRLLTPAEAKAATARYPNADQLHQFIDQHFPATNDQAPSPSG